MRLHTSPFSSGGSSSRVPSKMCQDCLRKRYDVVPVTGRVCEIEDARQRSLCTRAERPDRRRTSEERDELASPHMASPDFQGPALCNSSRLAPSDAAASILALNWDRKIVGLQVHCGPKAPF